MFSPPKLHQAQVTAANAACRLAAVAARTFDLELAPATPRSIDGTFELTVAINGIENRLFVPPRLLQRVAQSFFGLVRDQELPEALVASVLEAAIAPWLSRLEEAAGIEISLKRVAVAPDGIVLDAPLAFSFPMLAEGSAVTVVPAAKLSLPKLPATAWTSGEQFSLRLAMVIAEVAITPRELAELSTGDVVLLTGLRSGDAAELRLAISPGTAIIARIDGQKVTVARVGKAMTSDDATDAKPGTPAAAEPALPAAALEDVPLKVVFDLGDIELTFGELKTMVAGQVIDLARAPGNAVRISMNGRRIGAGEIVEIEGRLGVRVTELANGNERPAS
jgi:type III secretion protein Q